MKIETFEDCEDIVSEMIEKFFDKWYNITCQTYIDPLYELDKGLERVYNECIKSEEHSIECIKEDGEILLIFSIKGNPHYFIFSYTNGSFLIHYNKKDKIKEFKNFFKYLKRDCIKQSKINTSTTTYQIIYSPKTLKEKEKIRKKQNKTMKLIIGTL